MSRVHKYLANKWMAWRGAWWILPSIAMFKVIYVYSRQDDSGETNWLEYWRIARWHWLWIIPVVAFGTTKECIAAALHKVRNS